MTRRSVFLAAGLAGALATAAIAGEPWAERTTALGLTGAMPAARLTLRELNHLVVTGEELFEARFTTLDGAGRPDATQAIVPTKRRRAGTQTFVRTSGPDASSCAGCHNQPISGGAGDFVTNVFAAEGFESADFDTIDPQFSAERGTNHLFGAGLIELLAREMTRDLQATRKAALDDARRTGKPATVALESKGIAFGRLVAMPDGDVDISGVEGVDTDLVIRPFSQKGVIASLRQFTINALNQHHGIQAEERYGARWTGMADFDGDGKKDEASAGDISALVAWEATRHIPTRMVPLEQNWTDAAARGETQFSAMGCVSCHRPSLPLESLEFADPGPVDTAGTLNTGQVERPAIYDLGMLWWAEALERDEKGRYLVPLFGDLKRHRIADNQVATLGNELMSQRFVDRDIFMTAELWGIGSTAPYGHRGDITTLDEIIQAHGGDGRAAREAYLAASEADRSALIAFLKTLVIKP